MYYLLDTESTVFKRHDILKCTIIHSIDYTITNIIIKTSYDNIETKCDCDDDKNSNSNKFTHGFWYRFLKHMYKKIVGDTRSPYCDHIKWFGINFMKHPYPEWWTSTKLELFYRRYVEDFKTLEKGKNEECYICLDDMNYNRTNTFNCSKCNNSVHRICLNKYLAMNNLYYHKKICCICNNKLYHNKKILSFE